MLQIGAGRAWVCRRLPQPHRGPAGLYIPWVAMLFVGGCTPARRADPIIARADSAGVTIVTIAASPATVARFDLEAAPRRVITGGHDSIPDFVELGPVAWLEDGGITAADLGAGAIHLFDATGALVRSFGRRGKGPGEFGDITTLAVTAGDTLVIYDRSLQRATWFHRAMGLVRSTPLPGVSTIGSFPLGFYPLGKGRVLTHRSRFLDSALTPGVTLQRSRSLEDLLAYAEPGTFRDSTPVIDGRYGIWTGTADYRAPWTHRPFLAVDGGRVAYGPGTIWRVQLFDHALHPLLDVRWPVAETSLAAEEVHAFRARVEGELPRRMPSSDKSRLLDIVFAPAILPARRPAIGRVLLDPTGPIWVGRFEPQWGTTLGEPIDWIILDAGGVPEGQVHLPDAMRLEAVRGDTLLVVARDSRDVERIAVYRLVRHVR